MRRLVRRTRLLLRRRTRGLPLSQYILVAAGLVLAVAIVLLSLWIGSYLRTSVSQGVATTASAGIESLIGHSLPGLQPSGAITPGETAALMDVFAIGNDAGSIRLLQMRIFNPDGTLFFDSGGGIGKIRVGRNFAVSRRGAVVTRSECLPVPGAAAGENPVDMIKVYTPLRRSASKEVYAVAELYYSAQTLSKIMFRAHVDVWILVGAVGIVATGTLYLLVDHASRTISRQRLRLAHNLAMSRALSDENHALHAASEQQRLDASVVNEALLSRTGSDLHDGPIQLLTLIILKLTHLASNTASPKLSASLKSSIELATDAMKELRDISAGLVLPELVDLNLRDAIRLAICRHEETTGTTVQQYVEGLPEFTMMAVKVCAYRIVQEALRNAHRHGAPSGRQVTATVHNDVLTLLISNPARPGSRSGEDGEPSSHLGLRGMRFRVEALSGTLHVDISGSSRTTVTATIPLGTHNVAAAALEPA